MLIGAISDTHGHLPLPAIDALQGCDAIVHAGDIGNIDVILKLQKIAPVTAVLGNCDDPFGYGQEISGRAEPLLGGVRFCITHRPRDIGEVRPDVSAVIHGHTHRRRDEWVDGVRFINPGSAVEPREADGMRSVALIDVEDAAIEEVRFVLF